MDQAGTLVGVVSVIPELGWSDHVGQLRLLVDPAHRSQGIGREVARAALVQALELGLSKIIVEVVADQRPAINMFTLGGVGSVSSCATTACRDIIYKIGGRGRNLIAAAAPHLHRESSPKLRQLSCSVRR